MADPDFKYAAFPNLPTELLEHIGEELDTSFAALSSLIRVSTRFHTVFHRFLYDSPAKAHDPILIIGAARCGNLAALQLAHEKYGADLDRIRICPITAKEKSQLEIKYNLSPAARWGAPLDFAVAAGHMKVVNWLLSKGVDIEAPGRLYCGCETVEENMPDHYRGFEWEGTSGASDPRDREVMVRTPLHYAICQGRTNIAHRLLNVGASPSCIVKKRRFAGLHEVDMIYSDAPRSHNYDAFAEGSHLSWIKQHQLPHRALDDANGTLDTVTALHTAALRGNKSISRRLVRKMGVDINHGVDFNGKSPLCYAILSSDNSMTQLFLSLGADPITQGRVTGLWKYRRTEAVATPFALRRPDARLTHKKRVDSRNGGIRDYPTLIPVMEYLLQNGASTTIDFVWEEDVDDPLEQFLGQLLYQVSGEDRDIFAKKVAEDVTEIIRVVNLLASNGAFDFVGKSGRDGVTLLQTYGTLVGSKEHALDLSTRRRLRAGTIASIPRRLRKSLEVFETCH